VSTTSPFSFRTHPVASTIFSGVAVVRLVLTDELEWFCVLGLSVTHLLARHQSEKVSPGVGR
jgi:hypothetical protein